MTENAVVCAYEGNIFFCYESVANSTYFQLSSMFRTV